MLTSRDTSPKIQFANATCVDSDEIVQLVQSAYRGEASRAGWTTEADFLEGQRIDSEMLAEALGRPNGTVLTAWLGKELIGCCELEFRDERDEVYLGMFAVDPKLQSAGIGRSILAEAERVASSRWNASRMTIVVIGLRSELIEWYERRGYRRTGAHSAFPYGDERFGHPLREDLIFVELVKPLR